MKAQPPPLFYRATQAMMGPLMKSLGMSCETFHRLASEAMDRKLTAGEALRYRLHMVMCGVCRRLPMQFRRLRELVRRVEGVVEPVSPCGDCDCGQGEPALSVEAKERIAGCLRDTPVEKP